MNTEWHFPFMIAASLIIFFLIIRLVLSAEAFRAKRVSIIWLSLVTVVFGMLFGKYGATWGLPWWIYYPIPMLITVMLPPFILHLPTKRIVIYWLLSFLSAPLIHLLFSFFLGWTEYMPFWKVSSFQTQQETAQLTRVLNNYFEAIKEKDLKKMNEYTTADYTLFESGYIWNNDSLYQKLQGFKEQRIVYRLDHFTIHIDHETGHVYYFNHGDVYKKDSLLYTKEWIENATFRKEAGTWKIDFLQSTTKK